MLVIHVSMAVLSLTSATASTAALQGKVVPTIVKQQGIALAADLQQRLKDMGDSSAERP